jgi:23S rRNA pseudouridine1911/1915/1917 synthase
VKRQVREDGDRAVTRYETLKTEAGRSLLRLELETGRTHQIRVHLAHLGHPLVGDFLYGTETEEIRRPALHSAELSLVHPVTGEELSWTAPLPEDMEALFQ